MRLNLVCACPNSVWAVLTYSHETAVTIGMLFADAVPHAHRVPSFRHSSVGASPYPSVFSLIIFSLQAKVWADLAPHRVRVITHKHESFPAYATATAAVIGYARNPRRNRRHTHHRGPLLLPVSSSDLGVVAEVCNFSKDTLIGSQCMIGPKCS